MGGSQSQPEKPPPRPRYPAYNDGATTFRSTPSPPQSSTLCGDRRSPTLSPSRPSTFYSDERSPTLPPSRPPTLPPRAGILKMSRPTLERERQPYNVSYMPSRPVKTSVQESHHMPTSAATSSDISAMATKNLCPCCVKPMLSPLKLSCAHSICRDCLELNLPVQMSMQQDSSESCSVSCILCGKVSMLNLRLLAAPNMTKDPQIKPSSGMGSGSCGASGLAEASPCRKPTLSRDSHEAPKLQVSTPAPKPPPLRSLCSRCCNTPSNVFCSSCDKHMCQACFHHSSHVVLHIPTTTSHPLCFSCRDKSSEVVCLSCDKPMCQGCLDKHNRHVGNSRHTILLVDDVITCEEHDEKCGHICRVCAKFVCVLCILDNCGSHACMDIGTAARELSATKDQRTQANADHSMKATTLMSSWKQKSHESGRLLQSQTDRLVNAVCAEKQRLCNELEGVKKPAVKFAQNLQNMPCTVEKFNTLETMNMSDLPGGLTSDFVKALLMLTVYDLESMRGITSAQSVHYAPSIRHNEVQAIMGTLNTGRQAVSTTAKIPIVNTTAKVPIVNTTPKVPAVDTTPKVSLVSPVKEEMTSQPGVRSFKVPHPFKFSKIVFDRRKDNNALVGQYGDLIVRNDFSDDGNSISVYSAGGNGFPAQRRLLKSFTSIFDGDWHNLLPQVRPMSFRARGFISNNGVDLAYPEI